MKTGHAVKAFFCVLLFLAAIGGIFAGCGRKQEPQKLPTIKVNSAPEQGASVLMIGIEHGVTPVTIPDIPPGNYDVILKMDRYRRAIKPITVTE